MGSLHFSLVRNFRKDGNSSENGWIEWLRTSWTVFIFLVSGIFALITAILVAWPALAFLASRFFQ